MRLLVTGGAGFIGSNFVERSLGLYSDAEITVLDSLTYAGNLANLDGLLDRIDFVKGDIRDQQMVDELAFKCDAIVNFAAETHNDNSLKSPREFVDANVMGTLTLIQSALKHKKRFHQISTDEVFGDMPIDSIDKFRADSPYRPSSPYSASKAAADHLVRAWVRSFGLQATISNCSNNYGKRQHFEKLIPSTILSSLAGDRPKLYGSGKNVRDWIHVDDHVDGIWAVLEKGVIGRTYLFGGQQELSNLQVVKIVLNAVGLPEDHFDFVSDRPGHDLRYAIDNSESTKSLDWKPKAPQLSEYVGTLVDFYREAG
jgi:dTDP-glucose 4,6-dehydratase